MESKLKKTSNVSFISEVIIEAKFLQLVNDFPFVEEGKHLVT